VLIKAGQIKGQVLSRKLARSTSGDCSDKENIPPPSKESAILPLGKKSAAGNKGSFHENGVCKSPSAIQSCLTGTNSRNQKSPDANQSS